MEERINLILPPDSVHVTGVVVDRSGGEQHGIAQQVAASMLGSVSIDKFKNELGETLAKALEATQGIRDRLGEYSIDEISVGLAVSADGSIGVATAGVKATVQIHLRPITKDLKVEALPSIET